MPFYHHVCTLLWRKKLKKKRFFLCLLKFWQPNPSAQYGTTISLPSCLYWVPEWDGALWVVGFTFAFSGFFNHQETGGKTYSVHFDWMLPCLLHLIGLFSLFRCHCSLWIRAVESSRTLLVYKVFLLSPLAFCAWEDSGQQWIPCSIYVIAYTRLWHFNRSCQITLMYCCYK